MQDLAFSTIAKPLKGGIRRKAILYFFACKNDKMIKR